MVRNLCSPVLCHQALYFAFRQVFSHLQVGGSRFEEDSESMLKLELSHIYLERVSSLLANKVVVHMRACWSAN